MVRISFGMYNTLGQVDLLVDALAGIARSNYRSRYTQNPPSGNFLTIPK